MIRFVLAALTAALLVLMSSCRNGQAIVCDAENPCAGFGESCIDGQCRAGRCATSAQCPIEHYCENRYCVRGCADHGDCPYGFLCDAEIGECVARRCEDTKIDCGFKEYCNVATGECYEASGKYCAPCDPRNEVETCGDGNLCINRHCGVDCSGGRECPAGFECMEFENVSGTQKYYQCFTYCHLYEDYEPGSFVRAPAPEEIPHVVESCDGEVLKVLGVAP